ncbi:MAG TPA: penicillin-binding protein 2 [Candidatus Saccharimonadales bacterium]|nr:penicillin-binding protein 2 [Candidatus Saccharimonadales bacterium]
MKPQSAITNRIKILFILMAVFGVIFIVRLFYLQVFEYNYYQNQAAAQQLKELTIPATRGLIYAENGANSITPMVLNQPVYTLYADPKFVQNPPQTAAAINKVIGGDTSTYAKLLSDTKLGYVVLATKLNVGQYNAINKLQLYGVGLQQVSERVYPNGGLGSQLLGFVDADGNGQYGVEGYLNSMLAGTNGLFKAVTDVRGIPLTTSKEDVLKPAKDGSNILLTIDRNIQWEAEQALAQGLKNAKATSGGLVVMDPSTGRVLAMANVPTYNVANYQNVSNYSVFQNGVVSHLYEPGSDVKLLTMTAGINQGVVTPDTTFNNTGSVSVDGYTISNVETHNGPTTMQVVLNLSLNTGAVYVLQQLGGGNLDLQGRNTLYQYFTQRYGFGQKTGIEQSGEEQGIIFSPTNVQGNDIRYANMSFGQGMEATMLQVASAESAIVNGGTYYQPQLLAGTVNNAGQVVTATKPKALRTNIISSTTASTMRQMAYTALHSTTNFTSNNTAGFYTGGKTGTSQTIDPHTGQYTNNNPIGSYLGFSGGNGSNGTPKYVIMVRVDDNKLPGYAGSVAAEPIFATMSNWLLNYYGLAPSN